MPAPPVPMLLPRRMLRLWRKSRRHKRAGDALSISEADNGSRGCRMPRERALPFKHRSRAGPLKTRGKLDESLPRRCRGGSEGKGVEWKRCSSARGISDRLFRSARFPARLSPAGRSKIPPKSTPLNPITRGNTRGAIRMIRLREKGASRRKASSFY